MSYKTGEYALRPEEVNVFLSTVTDLTELALFKMAISCGLRRGDIVRLRWKDLDLNKNKVSYDERKKKRIKVSYFGDDVAQTLKMLRKQHPEAHYVFHGRSNLRFGKGHISEATAYRRFQDYLVRAGIQSPQDRRPFHALRATCIKMCQAKGWTAEQTAKHVGDTIRVIQDHYSTPSDDEMKAVALEKSILGDKHGL